MSRFLVFKFIMLQQIVQQSSAKKFYHFDNLLNGAQQKNRKRKLTVEGDKIDLKEGWFLKKKRGPLNRFKRSMYAGCKVIGNIIRLDSTGPGWRAF